MWFDDAAPIMAMSRHVDDDGESWCAVSTLHGDSLAAMRCETVNANLLDHTLFMSACPKPPAFHTARGLSINSDAVLQYNSRANFCGNAVHHFYANLINVQNYTLLF